MWNKAIQFKWVTVVNLSNQLEVIVLAFSKLNSNSDVNGRLFEIKIKWQNAIVKTSKLNTSEAHTKVVNCDANKYPYKSDAYWRPQGDSNPCTHRERVVS